MWHTFVSRFDTTLDQLISGFVYTCLRYPLLMGAFLIALAVLAVMLWVEVLKAWRSEPRPSSAPEEPLLLRLKR